MAEQVEGWEAVPQHHSAFVREFMYLPLAPLIVEYNAEIVRAGVRGDATYRAIVLYVRVRHQWDEKKQEWWSQGHLNIAIVKPGTVERYATGWKAQPIGPNWADDSVPNKAEIVDPLVEASRPQTTIRVIETPIEGAVA